jgi:hypothetical protein
MKELVSLGYVQGHLRLTSCIVGILWKGYITCQELAHCRRCRSSCSARSKNISHV